MYGMGKHHPGVQLGSTQLRSSSVEKDLEVLVEKSLMHHRSTWFTHSNPTGCWAAPTRTSPADKEVTVPLYSVLIRPPLKYCVQSSHKRYGQAGEGPEKDHKDGQWHGKPVL